MRSSAGEVHRITSDDGVALAYGAFGEKGRPVVVLCHGLGADRRQFADDGAFFARQGLRVLTPDLRGHGESGAPAGERLARDFSISRLARDMLHVLDHEGARSVDWVGNSLGGIVALELLAVAPARMRSLATFGTAYALNLPQAVAGGIPLLYGALGRRLLSGVMARLTSRDPAARALIGRMLTGFDQHAGRAVAENVRAYDLIGNARAFEGPILLLRGARDFGVNRALGRTIAGMAGHASFEVVDLAGAGHCANLDTPDALREALLTFWTRAPAMREGSAR